MHFRNGQAQGFALFATGSLARAAVEAIQNLVFDNDCVLRAEMAHKNMCAFQR
jgi:DNA-binding transcriptional regulator of glucitol operon